MVDKVYSAVTWSLAYLYWYCHQSQANTYPLSTEDRIRFKKSTVTNASWPCVPALQIEKL